MGNNTDRLVGQRGYLGDIFYPHQAVVGRLRATPMGEESTGSICQRYFTPYTQAISLTTSVELRIAVRAEILLYAGRCFRGTFHSDSGNYFSPFRLHLLCDKRRRIRGSGPVRIDGGRIGHYKLIGIDIAVLARPSSRLFDCHEIPPYSLWSGRAFSCVRHPARDPRRTGVCCYGLRPGNPDAPGSRCQRSRNRLDGRVVTWPLACLAALPPDQRMWGLRFGLSYSERCHGSVLDRASRSLGRGIHSFVARLQPVLDMDDLREGLEGYPQDNLASAARFRTEPDAVFLVPWKWSRWRLLAQKAIVVDRKGFPFREEVMREWHRRYLAIYDPEHGAGCPNDCTEETLRELQEMWGFSHAVVPFECHLPFPVIATSEEWKFIQVTDIRLRAP